MRWDGRRTERLRCVRVTFPDMAEREEYPWATGGSLSLSSLSDLRATGTLSFEGPSAPDQSSLLRLYYEAEDEDGQRHSEAMGTFFLALPAVNERGGKVSGDCDLKSVLRVAAGDCYGRTYTVSKGTNAVAKARAIIEGLGLRTNRPECAYVLAAEMTWDPDASWLKIANDLLAAAGYGACDVDGYGTVVMAPYVEPQGREPSWVFADNDRSIMEPETSADSNAGDVPNAYRAKWEDEQASLWACALNVDPHHPASVGNRGYVQGEFAAVDELAGADSSQRLVALKRLCEESLRDATMETEHVQWKHPWVPVRPGDAVEIDYRAAGLAWRGALTNMEVSLGRHISVESKARRFVRASIQIETQGGAW